MLTEKSIEFEMNLLYNYYTQDTLMEYIKFNEEVFLFTLDRYILTNDIMTFISLLGKFLGRQLYPLKRENYLRENNNIIKLMSYRGVKDILPYIYLSQALQIFECEEILDKEFYTYFYHNYIKVSQKNGV